MSKENVEIVRRSFAAFNAGDLETAASELHPEVEWLAYVGQLGGGPCRSRAEVVQMWSDIHTHMSGFQIDPVELIDCGEQVVAVIEVRGIGSVSGATVEQRWAQLYSFTGGLVRRMQPFPTREAALEAALPQE